MKREIQAKEDRLERSWPKKKNIVEQAIEKEKIEGLETTIEAQQKILEKLLHENCVMSAKLGDDSLLLSSAQQLEAQASYSDRIKYYKKQCNDSNRAPESQASGRYLTKIE